MTLNDMSEDFQALLLKEFPITDNSNITKLSLDIDSIGAFITITRFVRKQEIVNFLSNHWRKDEV